MRKTKVAIFSELKELNPTYALEENVDLVLIKYGDEVSVLFGRCLHRGALLSDGHIDGQNLVCSVHNWDYRYDTGVSEYDNDEALQKFATFIENDEVLVDADELASWAKEHPQPYNRDDYLGLYADVHGTPYEPYTEEIQELAKFGLSKTGHHGPTSAMGVPRSDLPKWEDIQILTGQLKCLPLFDEDEVGTELVVGPRAKRPLVMKLPLFVSDMSFGALSAEAKISLSKGAEMAGVGICSGEGGMLPEEQEENSRYLYELASAKFGFKDELLCKVQAFHFKGGQGAKTGTGGHLPGRKVSSRIAQVRDLPEGTPAISPPRFRDLDSVEAFRKFGNRVRDISNGIPIGFKMSAQHIEDDIDFALAADADYIIIDGRGGATGAAPLIFRDHISVPTIPALARARRHLDKREARGVTLIVTGGLRTAPDFIKAMALGADGIALANSAIQAIGCIAMRACHTNNCPVGITTQKDHLRARLNVQKSALQLKNFFEASTELLKVMARACGHNHLNQLCIDDLSTFNRDMAYLTGIPYAGVTALSHER